jgi:hypothetical protein
MPARSALTYAKNQRAIRVLLMVLAVFTVVPSTAWGSTVIGSDLANAPNANGTCGSSCTILESATTPNPITSPINGVVVSWSTLGGSGSIGTYGNLRLRIMRAAGGDSYTAVRSGPATSIPTNAGHPVVTTTVNPGLPISQGDYVGVDLLDGTSALAQRTTADSRFTYLTWIPAISDGVTAFGSSHTGVREMLYQVTIAPTPPTGQRAAAIKKCKKKFRHNARKRRKCKRKAKLLPV